METIEIAKINLDNEMDLILAHKRTMKLAELCGLSVSAQTTFATAVSEISRCAISIGKNSKLVLSIHSPRVNKKEILASVFDSVDLCSQNSEAISYAKRLMGDIHSSKMNDVYEIRISQHISFGGTITKMKIESFKSYFKNEPPLSPYDEIRKKNILLIELSDKLKESESQYRLLTDNLPLMMFACTNKGEVTFYNKWLKDFFALPDSRLTNIPWQNWIHPKDYKVFATEFEKSQAQKSTLRLQARLKNSLKEEYLWHLITIVPVKGEMPNSVSWIGFFVDIHAQKQIEETLKDNKELKLVQEELKEHQIILEKKIRELNLSNQDLEQFAYIASHDLQEPLRKIITFSSMIEKNQHELNDKSKHFFDKIISSSMQMSNLIKDVLNYSKLANPDDRFEDVDLNKIISAVISDYDLLIHEKKAVVDVDTLPVIKGIPLQLSQLFSNLLSNSLKFCNNPRILVKNVVVEGKNEDEAIGLASSANYLKITFSDNGIGFDKEYKNQIFNIFKRLNDRHTYKGTGIGLALCKKVMENHKGFIVADSELGKGATFTMYFPL